MRKNIPGWMNTLVHHNMNNFLGRSGKDASNHYQYVILFSSHCSYDICHNCKNCFSANLWQSQSWVRVNTWMLCIRVGDKVVKFPVSGFWIGSQVTSTLLTIVIAEERQDILCKKARFRLGDELLYS